jgi:hypothetical protein
MLAKAALLTFISFVMLAVVLMDRLRFLVPVKRLIFHSYGQEIEIFALALFLNTFLTVFLLLRRFFLKSTGQKLLHMDKQVKTGHSGLSREIAERFEE